jgi:hypothetical protein
MIYLLASAGGSQGHSSPRIWVVVVVVAITSFGVAAWKRRSGK